MKIQEDKPPSYLQKTDALKLEICHKMGELVQVYEEWINSIPDDGNHTDLINGLRMNQSHYFWPPFNNKYLKKLERESEAKNG
ncbi:MAG: hypothetical protein HRT35_07670 [Algicola sp.]|nr:hypothetical protein [Algicola sp.]